MGERVKVGKKNIRISREKGYLYFVGGDGNVYRSKMQHKGRKKSKQAKTLVLRTGVKRDNNYLYYIDSAGYMARTKRKTAKR